MERKIGEKFEYKGERLKVAHKEIGCKGCFFQDKLGDDDCRDDNVRKNIGHCEDCFRDDYRDVIFKLWNEE